MMKYIILTPTVNEMGSHCKATLLYLKIVFYWHSMGSHLFYSRS